MKWDSVDGAEGGNLRELDGPFWRWRLVCWAHGVEVPRRNWALNSVELCTLNFSQILSQRSLLSNTCDNYY